jgi:hypothetical protein
VKVNFKNTTKKGVGVGGTFLKACLCMDVQRFEGHSIGVSSTQN